MPLDIIKHHTKFQGRWSNSIEKIKVVNSEKNKVS